MKRVKSMAATLAVSAAVILSCAASAFADVIGPVESITRNPMTPIIIIVIIVIAVILVKRAKKKKSAKSAEPAPEAPKAEEK